MSSNLENLGFLAADVRKLLDAIRGGLIADMKTEQVQILEGFETAYNAALSAFTQQKGEALNQFNQERAEAFAAADSQLQQRRAAVDAVLADLHGHAYQRALYFDGHLHTKLSLGIQADQLDNTISEWVKVPSGLNGIGDESYLSEYDNLTVLHLKRAHILPGGYPDHVTDHSITRFQFVVANTVASSAQINTEIQRRGLVVGNVGGWDFATKTAEINVLKIAELHPSQTLFVRLVNTPYVDGTEAQEITAFGGVCSFSVDKVINYPRVSN
ncbi:hypothetical protein ABMY35_01090 [Pseudoalteromonas sp. BZB3]|uniref:hypothetical protein n=1 Tax=Pseudoalteromonas sp. BZB3 TaxID=3136670 RepID=UPI0032C4546C